MHIIVVGLSHRTAPVELRERFAFRKVNLSESLKAVSKEASLDECAILSTCNRVEVYGLTSLPECSYDGIKQFLSKHSSLREDISRFIYTHTEPRSIYHLFHVASGLDSMVIGETEIVGQLKEAYFLARQYNTIGKFLNALFQKALNASKHVRTTTAVSEGPVSVGSVAVELAQKIFGSLKTANIFVLGAGSMAETILKYLIDKGSDSIFVSSRSYKRAEDLANRFNGRAILFEGFLNKMQETDIVITSTSSPHFIIRHSDVREIMSARKHKPLFFIDISVPRNTEPDVSNIDGVYLYNIDDLEKIVSENLKKRSSIVEECRMLIDRKARLFIEWFNEEMQGWDKRV